MRSSGAVVKEVQEEVKFGLGPLGQNLDRTVGAIAHPARKAKPPRLVEGRGSIPHPLHTPLHNGVQATFDRTTSDGHSERN